MTDGPLIVQSDKTLLLEVDHDLASQCRREIAPFAELERSPEHVHTYRLTPLGLWNARAAGHDAEQVVDVLLRYSRYAVPHALLVLGGTAVLYGVLGVGLGLLLRNQAVAMTVALVWYFVVEQIAPLVLRAPHAQQWLPGGAADAFTRLGDPAGGSAAGLVAPWLGGGLLAAYALGLAVLATAALVHRDQT